MSTDTRKQQQENDTSSSSVTEESINDGSSSEQTPTTDTTETPAEEPTSSDSEDDLDQAPDSKTKREAIRYRQRLRETETKLAALAEIVVNDKLAGLNLGTTALKAADVDLSEMFDESGAFDDSKLLQAVTDTHQRLGIAPGRLEQVTADYRASGVVDWRAGGSGGYVGSAGTGGVHDGGRPTFEEAKERARQRAEQQRRGTAQPAEPDDLGQRWHSLLDGARGAENR